MLAVLGSVACASAGPQRPVSVPFSPDLLTWTEITAERSFDAYSAIERLRPNFFHLRPGASVVRGQPPIVRVYINGDYAGDIETLRTIPAQSIESIRRVRPVMAFTTLGTAKPADEVLMIRLHCRRGC